MFKVLIWDYTGVSAQWMEQVADKKNIEVVGTITSQDSVPEILLSKDAWDWLLIFEQGQRNFFEVTTRVLRLPLDKVIYALDMNSWAQHPKAAYNLVTEKSNIFLYLNFNLNRRLNDFVTCTVEGLNYIATSKDTALMRVMYTERKNFAADELNCFHALAKKFYNVDDSAGYFLDLGANIGTTGIYFCKKLAPNLKLLAFEPDSDNFKLLHINTILNDLEDGATLVNCGLGFEEIELPMYKLADNPGGNSVLKFHGDQPTEMIKIIPLDSYLAENKIAAEEVKYIWIDTEGFEPQVLLGAKNLLAKNPAPVFMEFNPMVWSKTGYFEKFISLLKTFYSHFIWVPELMRNHQEKIYPIDKLWDWKNSDAWIGSLGDIFLIRDNK